MSSVDAGGFLEKQFKLSKLGTNLGTEFIAGLTTFMVMAYIIFVNPATLNMGGSGLDIKQVATVTCLVAGVMSIAMGLYTNRAVALAPGLGINAIVAFTLVGSMGLTFPEAMGVVVTEGIIVTLLVLTGVRRYVLEMVPLIMKKAIGVGIGLFILLLGLKNAGVIMFHSGDFTAEGSTAGRLDLAPLNTWPIFVAIIGLLAIIILMARNVKAAIFWGMIIATIVAYIVPGNVAVFPDHPFSGPDFALLGDFSFGYFSKLGALTAILVVISLLMTDFFDTMGTLIAVGGQAGYLDEKGEFPDAEKPLLIDSLAAVAGGAASASSATSYIESTAGVSVGGRSGLTVVVTGILFLLALPFVALVGAVPAVATAPALIVVGLLMMNTLADDEGEDRHGQRKGIDWSNMEDAFPVALTMLVMPFTFNITYGIGAGFVSYVIIKLARGKAKEVNPAMYVIAALFLLYFLRWALFDAQF
ncbi:MAG: NCS2 family permease [Thermomicrobiales bacterium]|nr:NCS2 family permease [Thermomicrobiales bacterium]MCO5219888.1 NCS2 family permease [Thermomicrobiales bacterium]MCO5226379.1 NCS2 family permease [Thermomicrobiales bacterium]MCO5228928.1 NCS2 family permease [Thermomicrobiales bacterium]